PSLVCPVYCRYCFRREEIGARGAVLGRAALERAFAYIRGRPEIWEVIVTGGDPFVLSPRRISGLVASLYRIDHVHVIRLATPITCSIIPAFSPPTVSRRLPRGARSISRSTPTIRAS